MNQNENPQSPWRTAWFQPRLTIQIVLKKELRYGVFPIAALIGLDELLSRAMFQPLVPAFDVWMIILFCLLLAIPLGRIIIFVQGGLLGWMSESFGGTGTLEQTQTVVMWSSLPLVFDVLFKALEILVMGPNSFRPLIPVDQMGMGTYFIFSFSWLVGVVTLIWSLVLKINGLAEVHQFSRWRAAGSIFTLYIGAFVFFGIPHLLKFLK
jgi:hypothetical protein